MRNVVVAILVLLAVSAKAQTEPEYRLEVGAGVGMVTYEGDFNGNVFSNMQPMFTLLAKYKFNPRMAVAMNASYGSLKGAAKDVTSHLPEEWTDYSFNTKFGDVGVRLECNFWPYGTGMEYRGAQRLTPYIFIGLGATIFKADQTKVAMNLPLGVGAKYKVGDRVNVALEWAMHFCGSDHLDGVTDALGIKSTGIFKNTDCYSQLRLSLTYDLWAKCKTCHNDRD